MQKLEAAQNEVMIGRKGLEQERPARKREHEDVIAIVEIADKLRNCSLRLRNLRLHAARSVDQNTDRDRRVQVLAEELDRTILAVERKLEVAALKSGDVTS